jgi:hypothetical protein
MSNRDWRSAVWNAFLWVFLICPENFTLNVKFRFALSFSNRRCSNVTSAVIRMLFNALLVNT